MRAATVLNVKAVAVFYSIGKREIITRWQDSGKAADPAAWH